MTITNEQLENPIEAAKILLEGIKEAAPTPWKVNESSLPHDQTVIATIRNVSGYPVLAPHPESSSMLTGDRNTFEFVVFAPRIIQELLDIIEANNRASADKKQPQQEKVAPNS